MSHNSIYPTLLPNHYQAMNIEEKKEEDYQSRVEKQRKEREEYQSRVEKQRKEREEYQSRVAKQLEDRKERIRVREEIERNKTFCEKHATEIQCTVCVIPLIVVGFIALFVFSILLGTIVIVSNYVFETTMVALYGRAIYNKNFPICSNDTYQGSDCYTRTSTYCS